MTDPDRGPQPAPVDAAGRRVPDIQPPASPARPCPGCGARGPVSLPSESHAVRCLQCRLVYIDPVPAEAITHQSYGPVYYEPWQGREARSRLRLWRRRLGLIEARSRLGTLLDVGCGDGLFLSVAREAGWRVDGIEFSPEGARRSSQRLGRPVAVGDLARERGLRGPFDVVTLWHVLEHLVDPGTMLDAARARLRPGGLLVVAVPNLDNLPMRAAYRLARGRPLPLYETGAREPHISHFDPRTLPAFLARRGFTTVELRPDRCALTLPKRGIDALAAFLSIVSRRLLTDAMVAFCRRP
ncbi:MAG TPA: class I SAM-dependent methyltransferase [Candidatus Polarisedimenticolia bacterium]|nr:class I SAM-dependent methyltransferase [Candidatus Polarisedimenticolia bacterium]